MKLYITRHGQVGINAEYLNGNASLPRGEMNLSDLGRAQATLLGKYLKKLNFKGKILASPLWRTMETAEAIPAETGSVIFPAPFMHEIFMDQELRDAYRGATLDQLKDWYPHVSRNAEMVYPWWPETVESSRDVRKRVSAGIDALIEQYGDTDEEILLVGHGASSGEADEYLNLNPDGMLWNCCLSLFDTKNTGANFGKNVSFLPVSMITNNKHSALDYASDKTLNPPYDIRLPEEVKNTDRFKILHIGVLWYVFHKSEDNYIRTKFVLAGEIIKSIFRRVTSFPRRCLTNHCKNLFAVSLYLALQKMNVILLGRTCRHTPVTVPTKARIGCVASYRIAYDKYSFRRIGLTHKKYTFCLFQLIFSRNCIFTYISHR